MFDLNTEQWQQIRDAFNDINDNPAVSRTDLKFGHITVLIYRAGTVIRVDFKET